MSRTFAFAIGVAIITLVLWLLFSPAQPPADGGIPRTGDASEPAASGTTERQTATAPGQQTPPASTGALTSDTAASSEQAADVPPPIPGSDQPRPTAISLWQQVTEDAETEADGFPATRLQADPGSLESLHVGQHLVIDIPDLNQPLTARIESTHNQLDNVQVFRGPVMEGHDNDNVIITRGERATYVVVSTREGVYSTVIDNATGDALLTDERDILARQRHDDMIPVPGIEQEPPTPVN